MGVFSIDFFVILRCDGSITGEGEIVNLYPAIQMLADLELIPELVIHLPLSIVVESLRINGVSVFDEIDDITACGQYRIIHVGRKENVSHIS